MKDSMYMECPEQVNPQRKQADCQFPGQGCRVGGGGGGRGGGYEVTAYWVQGFLSG